MDLNREQLRAVRCRFGPLLIVAGAGTGKTRVVTERIKYLIAEGLVKPSEVLALTFTEKAAKEMQDRVDESLPLGYAQMWISTFHSFGDRILRREALHIGLDPKYTLMTTAETIQFLRSRIFDFDLDYFRPLGNPTRFVTGLVQHFSRLQDEDVSPDNYLSWARSQKTSLSVGATGDVKLEIRKWLELARAYKKYEELKIKEGVMDYGDLIVKTLWLLRSRPNVLAEYRKLFKYILVDEFQDTNIAQYELIKLLAPPSQAPNLTVVGDDSQSIYKFRGAAVSNILSFRKDYPKAKMLVLTKNYRSTQRILDGAYRLIKFNDPDTLEAELGISKNLLSQTSSRGEDIEFIHADRVENEAEAVADEIQKLTRARKFKFGEIAILVRANNHSEPFVRALGRHGIPHQFLGPGRLFRQPEILDLISYLRVLNNLEDSIAFYRLLSLAELGIPPREIAAMNSLARKQNRSLFEVAEMSENATVAKIVGIVNKQLGMIRRETAGQLLYYFLEEMDLLPRILNPSGSQGERKAANIAKFFDKLKTYETDHQDANVPAVVDWIELASEIGESPLAADVDWDGVDAVNLLTVHSAKGLEFPVVFLVNLVAQRFPTLERREQIPIPDALVKEMLPKGDYHLEEERRLFYVGMTRAMNKLYLTAADYYGEGKREKKLSPFVYEVLGGKISNLKPAVAGKFSSLENFKKSPEIAQSVKKIIVDYLSYSQIETFKTCPLHYKLSYILRIPTPPSGSQIFGTAIHAAMKSFYESISRGEKASERLMFDLLASNWSPEGYKSKAHERKFFEKAKVYLSGYLKEGFDPKVLPLALEQKFVVPLLTGRHPLRVGGVIDRIDELPDGTVEIIDYKTGATIPTQREVERNLQLTLYALAATTIPEKPFARKIGDLKLSLYFFDSQEKITTTRTTTDLDRVREEILAIRDEIEASDFACSGSILCQDCEFKLFCGADR